jgi:hypothetical protein
MKTYLQISTIALLATFTLSSSAKSRAFEWPDSSRYWRVMINVNQYVQTYIKIHPQWFSQDRLVTDFKILSVPPGGEDQAAKEYKSVRHLLESKGMYVGTYVSGTTLLPESEQAFYPHGAVSIEQLPATTHFKGSWAGHQTRKIVDISDVASRRALEASIKRLWESVPAPLRFVDNTPAHPSVAKMQPWAATCAYMTEMRELGESVGSRVIFNIAVNVGEMSDSDTRALIQAVGEGGLSIEMPWSPVIRRSKEATARAQKRYRQLLDTGMGIILIPVNTPEDELTQWVQSWRKRSDHIYIALPFQKPPNIAYAR